MLHYKKYSQGGNMQPNTTNKKVELQSVEKLALANIMIDGACHMHAKSHIVSKLTDQYLQYYFTELQSYTPLFDAYLECFFASYKPSDIYLYMEIYARAPRTLGIKYKKRKRNSYIDYITPHSLPLLSYNFGSEERNKTITRLHNIIQHLNADKEIISFEQRYRAMKRNALFLKKLSQAEKDATQVYLQQQQPQIDTTTQKTTLTKQVPVRRMMQKAPKKKKEGRITRLVIPEIILTNPYPTDIKTSRVDTHYKATHVKPPANTLSFVNRWGFQKAIIRTGFYRKHKSMHRKKSLLSVRPF